MSNKAYEESLKACYSTWSDTYYSDYYGDQAAYPPVHRDLLKRLLREAGVRSLLDAGCGPASFLRELIGEGIDLYGFDLTPEMVAEAKRVMQERGIPPSHIWEGSVLSPESFKIPRSEEVKVFDAVICAGVFPHIPQEKDLEAIENLRNGVKEGGLVIVEARNQLFSLFTLNRYSYHFFVNELIDEENLKRKAGAQSAELTGTLKALEERFRMDLPEVRKGKASEPGYDEVLSRTHNPLVLRQQFVSAGLKNVRLLFYHYHCLPPMCAPEVPELFRSESLAMEDPEDWRGYFMASAFLLAGERP